MGVYIAVVRKIRTTAADHQSHNIEKIAQSGDTVATIDIPCLCRISTCRKSRQVCTKLNLCKIAEKNGKPLDYFLQSVYHKTEIFCFNFVRR